MQGDPHLSRAERPYRRRRVRLNIRLGKGRRKNLRPYLLKICAFMLSNEDQIRGYFEQRARHARNPVKVCWRLLRASADASSLTAFIWFLDKPGLHALVALGGAAHA